MFRSKSFLPPRSARMRFCKSVWGVDAFLRLWLGSRQYLNAWIVVQALFIPGDMSVPVLSLLIASQDFSLKECVLRYWSD